MSKTDKALSTLKSNTLSRMLEIRLISGMNARQIYFILMSDYPSDMIQAINSMQRQGIDRRLIELWASIWAEEFLADDLQG